MFLEPNDPTTERVAEMTTGVPRRRRRLLFPSRDENFTGLPPDRQTLRDAGFFDSGENEEPESPNFGLGAGGGEAETLPAAPAVQADRFPALTRYERTLQERPVRETPSRGRRLGGALAAAAAEFARPGAGASIGESIIEAPHRRKVRDWEERLASERGIAESELQRFGLERQTTADDRAKQEFEMKKKEFDQRQEIGKLELGIKRKQAAGAMTPEEAAAQRKTFVAQFAPDLPKDVAEAYILTGQLKPDKTIDDYEAALHAAGGDWNKAIQIVADQRVKVARARGEATQGGTDRRADAARIERAKKWRADKIQALREGQNKRSTKRLSPEELKAQEDSIEKEYLRMVGEVDVAEPTGQPGTPAPKAGAGAAKTPAADRVRVKSPDGQVGTIPRSQLQDALKAGYTQVQ